MMIQVSLMTITVTPLVVLLATKEVQIIDGKYIKTSHTTIHHN